LGRYPFLTVLKQYLATRAIVVKESTLDNERRILKHLAGEIQGLADSGKMSTTNPKKMTKMDIKTISDHLAGRVDPDTRGKYLQYLNGVLLFAENPVIENMKREGFRIPRGTRKPIHSLDEGELAAIQSAARELEGWKGVRASFLTICYPATGARPSELRLAHVEDLNVKNWTLWIRHPKGEGSWGEPRTVLVLPQYRREILRYLKEREAYVRSCGRSKATYLIPRCENGQDSCYSSNAFRKLKKEVQELAGVEFKLKDFRPTFAQRSIDLDPNLLPDVSTMLGHSSVKTTQRYYAQISCDHAAKRLESAWAKELQGEQQYPGDKTNLIDSEKWRTGYIW
jgi:integrase